MTQTEIIKKRENTEHYDISIDGFIYELILSTVKMGHQYELYKIVNGNREWISTCQTTYCAIDKIYDINS